MTILCEPDAQAAALLAPFLGDDVQTVVSLRAAARALAADPTENLIVIGSGIRLENALSFTSQVSREHAGMDVILMRDWVNADLISRALDAGVHTVLPTNERHALAEARKRAIASRHVAPAPVLLPAKSAGPGVTVAILAAKGGCGKTTFAINLALALNANGTRRVCLLDLDLEFGDVASSLHVEPRRTLLDAVPGVRNLNRAAVSSLVTPIGPALDCILAPVGPGEAERVPPQLVPDLLAALPALYDYVVVDTPARLPAHVLAALDAADHHVLVTAPEVPALRSLRQTLDVLDLLAYRRDSRSIIVNRTDSRVVMSARDVEAMLHSPIAGHVPFSWDVPGSINRGAPIIAAEPDHPVSKAIRAFARTRISTEGRAKSRTSTPRRSVRGWTT
ncbi:MAG: AAA family ATPase [Jatrophihabitantaceae bacterium]